jgi:hypothetical protein
MALMQFKRRMPFVEGAGFPVCSFDVLFIIITVLLLWLVY